MAGSPTGGNASFFLGTDSAPHPIGLKETDCGCAGIFNAPTAIELYAQVFDEEGALRRLEAFASLNGPAFYGLPPNEDRITLLRTPLSVPREIRIEGESDSVRPFRSGETLSFSLASA